MTSSEAAGKNLELGTVGGGQIIDRRARRGWPGEGGQETGLAELASKKNRRRRRKRADKGKAIGWRQVTVVGAGEIISYCNLNRI